MQRPGSRRARMWADGLTIVTIVSLGICVAALLDRASVSEPADLSAPAPVTSSPPSQPVDTSYRTSEVPYPVDVPGCDLVLPPPPDGGTWGQIFTSEDSYDNPQYPWYSGPRSVSMTRALLDALPDGVEIAFGSRRDSLEFQPIPQSSTDAIDPVQPGWASASADIERGGEIGRLAVSVSKDESGVPPCVAGSVQQRTVYGDLVMHTNESWSELGGVRTTYRSVTAYAPDGSTISAAASDGPDRALLLSVDELTSIVTLPALRMSADVPVGTPDPRAECNASYDVSSGSPIDADQALEMNDALAGVDIGRQFDPALNTLQPEDFDPNSVCTRVDVLDTGADLTVSIQGGQEVPVVPSVYDPAYASSPDGMETLDDGSVLVFDETRYSSEPASSRRSVTVTHPSGTRVQVISTAEGLDEPLGFDDLRTIAIADGLDIL